MEVLYSQQRLLEYLSGVNLAYLIFKVDLYATSYQMTTQSIKHIYSGLPHSLRVRHLIALTFFLIRSDYHFFLDN